jgi:3-mercaptopyruvate sulfurtransferase SseA
VALALMVHGWKNVHPLYGGFDAWAQAGYPLEPKGT